MSAEVLRAAARSMRERAEPVTDDRFTWFRAETLPGFTDIISRDEAAFIASWHPVVALAVADWLTAVASGWQQTFAANEAGAAIITRQHHAVIVARAYLGDQP